MANATNSSEIASVGGVPSSSESKLSSFKKVRDSYLRKLFPSASKVTYNPIMKFLFDLVDVALYPVFGKSRIPPNHLRIRVGCVSVLFNQLFFLFAGVPWWINALSKGWFRLDSTVVDIGCGCGRYAMHLRDYNLEDERFTGKYYGIDIDDEMLAWCRKYFDAERFEFFRSTDASSSYNKKQKESDAYVIPLQGAVADFVFSTSLFSHLLEDELKNYLAETFRILKPGGWMAHTVYCTDYPPETMGGRHTFAHQIGAARVESMRQPEAAVAYSAEYLLAAAHGAGLSEVVILASNSGKGAQRILAARRPRE